MTLRRTLTPDTSATNVVARFVFDPIDKQAIQILVSAQAESGNHSDACKLLARLVRLEPASAIYIKNYAFCLQTLGRFSEAANHYKRTIALAPDDASGWEGLGFTTPEHTIRAETGAPFFRAAAIQPYKSLGYSNLGAALLLMGRSAEAVVVGQQAIALNPGSNKAHTNLGNAFKALGNLNDAAVSYGRSLVVAADDPSTRWNNSMLLLLKGNLRDGFPMYEARLQLPSYRQARFPRWNGADSVEGRKLLVRAEQGLGDTIQFCRFIDGLRDRNVFITFSVSRTLWPLLSPNLKDVVIDEDSDALPRHDYEVSLMSLPAILGIDQSHLPFRKNYLVTDPRRRERWLKVLPTARLKVGIAWQGKLNSVVDQGRSFSLDYFSRIASISGVQLISLQKGNGTEQVARCANRLNLYIPENGFDEDGAFVDTAAIMMCLDLVITSDTAIAHLAGALGVPVWVVLQQTPEWRWMLNRNDSPWYPTMRLFRQSRSGSWDEPFTEITEAISTLCRKGLA